MKSDYSVDLRLYSLADLLSQHSLYCTMSTGQVGHMHSMRMRVYAAMVMMEWFYAQG